MKITDTLINKQNYQLNNNKVGKFKNQQVKQHKKKQIINLQDKTINIKKNSKTLLDRQVSSLKTKSTTKTTAEHNNNKTKIENNNLADIYIKCMKTKNILTINQALDQFLQTLNQEYSANNLPSTSQKKILYKAYLNMSAHYLSVKPTTNSKNKNSLQQNNANIKYNKKEFCDFVHCAIETNDFLKNNMNDPTYVSAQMQQLVGKGCFTEKDNNFIYGKCLSIYNHPEPRQVMAKLQKKRLDLLAKDNSINKENNLKEVNYSIENIKTQLEHVKHENLSTQKTFIHAVFDKRLEIAHKKLDEMITAHINTLPKSKINIDLITANIMQIVKKDLAKTLNSGDVKIKNDQLAVEVISFRVKVILEPPDESSC